MRRHPKKQKGFTLIETIIYTALVCLIATLIILVTQAVFYARAQAHTVLILQENLQYAMTRIVNQVHTATGITSPLNDSSSTLILPMADPQKDPITFALSNGVIIMKQGAGAEIPLTSSELVVTTLNFTAAPGTAPGVWITITGQLPGNPGPFQSTLNLEDFAVIRR